MPGFRHQFASTSRGSFFVLRTYSHDVTRVLNVRRQWAKVLPPLYKYIYIHIFFFSEVCSPIILFTHTNQIRGHEEEISGKEQTPEHKMAEPRTPC